MAHTCNPSTHEAEVGGFLNSKLAWTSEQVPGWPGLHIEKVVRYTIPMGSKRKDMNKHSPADLGQALKGLIEAGVVGGLR